MRVFIGYAYSPRDRWVEAYATPMVQVFGCEVVHGKVAFGGALDEEVRRLIRTCEAMIGFTTRRELLPDGSYSTHPWVLQELAEAQRLGIPYVEVREDGVVHSRGTIDSPDFQWIDYREADRAACLVQIAQAVGRFLELTRVTRIRLGPATVVDEITAVVDHPSFSCSYQTLRAGVESSSQSTLVRPISGNLYLYLRRLNPAEPIRVSISAGGRTWRSNWEILDTVDVPLRSQE